MPLERDDYERKAMSHEINNLLDAISGLSKFHSDVDLFLLGFAQFIYIWVHVRSCEVFKTVKLLLASL